MCRIQGVTIKLAIFYYHSKLDMGVVQVHCAAATAVLYIGASVSLWSGRLASAFVQRGEGRGLKKR